MNDKNSHTNRTLFITDYCFTPHRRIKNAAILCENERITAIGNESSFSQDTGMNIYDLRNTYAVPGFIDTHIHGTGGFDSTTADERTEDFNLMCNTLAGHGVTYFLPTIISRPEKKFISSITAFNDLLKLKHTGAEPLGIRLEGPYISKKKGGSQNAGYIRNIDLGELKEIVSAGQGNIKIMTFAPELKNSIKLIEILRENGIIPSMGHTAVEDEKTVLKAIDAGATHVTHLYNGMPLMHHRSVGLAGVAMTDDRVTTEIIIDGYHIQPRMIDIVSRTKPKNKIIGISDAIQGAGLKDGTYHLGKTQISVEHGRAFTNNGTIAGTTITLEKGWNNLVCYSQLDMKDAAACLTINPATLMNLKHVGELKAGSCADIVFFNKNTNKPVLTARNGKIIYIDKTQKFQQDNHYKLKE
ncbi:MAG: N-acetylglucosamine-6-phosphate deacetylase [Victivallales bacterium]|nr:N-acetylglucosamine-6-phosphate deacetylase [Victivallales bacterium]MCF7889529.1 N-acetylglucosamine-6-phosphate deacetylase [Victivallales bacterium]